MVKAELNYNPYLLETVVKFNGQEPKINSLVEKYLAGKLQNWIDNLPLIFYSEMNGWDFELDFSGTRIDFDSLRTTFDKAFEKAGVSKESVCLFYKNELESAPRKVMEVSDLFEWFENNPNRKFDFTAFKERNIQLFNINYSFVVIQGALPENDWGDVTVESVTDVSELGQAVLENVPILFFVNEGNRNEFKYNLVKILKRDGIIHEQLFFCIAPEISRSQVERVIKDLGVLNPQVVDTPTDVMLKKYLEIYPMTAYIGSVIEVLRKTKADIKSVLQDENEQSVSINGSIREKIDTLNEIIRKLKSAAERIAKRDNYEIPAALQSAKNTCVHKIENWRKWRIKITSDKEAGSIAVEFSSEIGAFFETFKNQVDSVFQAAISSICSNLASDYFSSEFDDGYTATQECTIDLSKYELPKFIQGLLERKEERMVDQADRLIENLKNVFMGTVASERELRREVTYTYESWRDYAETMVSPVLDDVIMFVGETLLDFYTQVAEDYLGHLRMLIGQQTETKDEVAAQLSDDERKLQADNDWFAEFQEKLREIERS